jgi:translation initiation factor 3 subunit D
MIEEFELTQLLKLQTNLPTVEDLAWCGHIDRYDDSFDKTTTRLSKPLRRVDNVIHYDVSSKDDPILEKFAVDNTGDVYATDSIIAQLMASPRSVYSWDIVIDKTQFGVFMDKRDNSGFDLLTVSETAHDAPSATEEFDIINHPEKLSLEATSINQNFSQQILLDSEGSRKSYEPNPFFDDSEPGVQPASVAYRYRKFTLGAVKLVARCELHAWGLKKKGNDSGESIEQLMNVHALNEWDARFAGGVNWRQKIDQQPGAVLLTELKNNSCKLAKWTAQSLLSGADQLKIGYVSRVVNTNAHEHIVLAAQTYKPKDFAAQINLNLNNVWGIVKMVCDLVLSKPDGQYILMKDPNKQILRLYEIPAGELDEDGELEAGEEDEDAEDDGEEGDEDKVDESNPEAARGTSAPVV